MSAAIETVVQSKRHALPCQPPGAQIAVDAVLCVQRELRDFVAALSDEQYVQKPVGVIQSSIGGHVRHCLDHVEAVLAAARTKSLNYDLRERGTDVETDRLAAMETMRRQESELSALRGPFVDRRLKMTAVVCAGAPALETATSLSRELAFVVSHTVHHNSLLAAMAAVLGVPVPQRFGYAPATLAWMDGQPCAR